MKTFLSDNSSAVHPKILEAIIKCNKKHEVPYGDDIYTKRAVEKFRKIFGKNVDVYFVTNDIAANVIGISSMVEPSETVICIDNSKTNKCKTLEKITKSKISYVKGENGKITIDSLKDFLRSIETEKKVKPKVVSITQATEIGTVYSLKEVRELSNFVHENGLLLHVDGGRICNAAVSLGVSLKDMIKETGVDLLSFGGTKNGMMFGEAIISFNRDLTKNLKFIIKQDMQLISKMRYVSAQFIAYLEDNLWKKNAQKSNCMAKILEADLRVIEEVEIIENVQANMIFAKLPREWIDKLRNNLYFCIVNEEKNIIRMITSFDTTIEDVNKFVTELKRLQDS